MKNYYAILEVPVGSDISEIREAYRRLVQENLWNKEVFADLKEAYEVLSTPGKRREYDQAAFGQSFGEPEMTPQTPPRDPDRRCPLQAGPQCPVINGRVPAGEPFCPECGFLTTTMPAEGFAPVTVETDITKLPRLEEETGDRQHRLRAGMNSVGREAADVLLTDKTVSRRHAQIELTEAGEVFVEDLGSTNGTRIFETVLPPHDRRALRDGDTVRFGSISLILRLPEAPAQAAAASPPEAFAEIPPLPTEAPYAPPELPEAPWETPVETIPSASVEPAADAAPQAVAPLARLSGERHGTLVREDHLVPGVTTFGRRAENTVVLRDDPYISGVHAQIIADEESFRLTDLGSTNGTFLNGTRLVPNEPSVLQPGDKIGIGGLTYLFEPNVENDETNLPIIEEL